MSSPLRQGTIRGSSLRLPHYRDSYALNYYLLLVLFDLLHERAELSQHGVREGGEGVGGGESADRGQPPTPTIRVGPSHLRPILHL